jgi:serine/threonine-protein kinase
MRLGLPAEAQAECQKSIAIQPSASAYSNLGTSFYVLGNYSAAAEAFEKAVGLAPKNFRSSAYLGDALMLVPGRDADARRSLTTAVALGEEELRINPSDARTRAILARCLARLGQRARAWDEAQRATREAPEDPNVLKPAAEAATILGHRTEAVRWLEVAVPKGLGTVEIEHNPDFSGLKDDPAFQALFKRPAPRPARSP